MAGKLFLLRRNIGNKAQIHHRGRCKKTSPGMANCKKSNRLG